LDPIHQDSAHVIKQTKEYTDEFTFITIDDQYHSPKILSKLSWDTVANMMNRHQVTSTTKVGGMLFNSSAVHPTTMSKQIIANMLLLASTDMLVGKFTSNVFRIAFQLMSAQSARSGCTKPYISLDSPWCFDFRVISGVNTGERKLFMC
jgi:hypothetical protein